MDKSWLPEGGENLFQLIRRRMREAEKQGIELLKLSIGVPQGPALLSARRGAASAVMSEEDVVHEYQESTAPGVPGFAKKFVAFHTQTNLAFEDVSFLPIIGIKSSLKFAILACGAHLKPIKVATTTDPGYPTPKDWCGYLKTENQELPLNVENEFRFSPKDIEADVDLVMVNYPHNPTGQIATREWWRDLCEYCSINNIRLFNDGAYAVLSHSKDALTLTDVAVNFPNLSWVEEFSASKVIGNGTGWRVAVAVGSPDFIGDIEEIQGNDDSGLVAFAAAGVLTTIGNDKERIEKCRRTYERRQKLLISVLKEHNMRLAVEPGAGFFTLWRTPKRAFGEEIKTAKQFNFMMIERTGVVGVHFDPYIRYAVCTDTESMIKEVAEAFEKAQVSYQ